MRIVIQPTFPGRRRNSPCADTLCSDLAGLTALPAALFVADEAGITVTVDGGSPAGMRVLIGIGADSEFSDEVYLSVAVPGLGTIERVHAVELGGTVGDAITACAIAFATSLAEAVIAAELSAELQVLGHNNGEALIETSF